MTYSMLYLRVLRLEVLAELIEQAVAKEGAA